ncbi:hypothetical protein [Bdellovibrio bacteriovorus]|uniref:hypothetical protein n=1 Tax=Bdellovibrio TaxID=958 RepID=UPI0035A92AC2
MSTRIHKLMLAVLFLCTFSAVTGYAQGLCQVSAKSHRLAMDQRDDLRLKCLKQKKSQINVSQCLNVAKSMEYSTNAEDARLVCLYDLRPTLKECFAISKSMEYPDSGDEARWECLRRFNKTITAKQCKKIAESMSYPANAQRADQYCSSELQ